MKTPTQRKETVKAFAAISPKERLLFWGVKSQSYAYATFPTKKMISMLKSRENIRYHIVPCTITYSLPIKKKK